MLVNGQEVQLVVDLSRGEDDPKTSVTLDFAQMKANGIVGCLSRAVDGVIPDPTYPIFRANALAAGMPFGAFGTMYPGDMSAQAKQFIEVVEANPAPELPNCADWEVDGVTWQMADTYFANIEVKYPGKEVINYTRAEYLKRALPNRYLQAAKYARFAKIAVWQANYGVLKPVDLPVGFSRVLWQFTDRLPRKDYSTTGESLQLDMSYFYGSLADFYTRFGLLPTAPQPPEPPVPSSQTNVNMTVTLNMDKTLSGTWKSA